MCEDFAPNCGDKGIGCCILFHQLAKNNMTVLPTHLLHFSLFPRLKIKLKGRHIGATEVIEAESQAVLNTFTDRDFQDAFKSGRRAGDGAYARKGTTSRMVVANRPKVSF
jgi:hypothetical protein